MKKLPIFFIALCLCFALTSCYHDYSCNCSYSDSVTAPAIDVTQIHGTQSHALHQCCVIRKAQITAQGHPNVTCALPI
jgi:hypothetical protein